MCDVVTRYLQLLSFSSSYLQTTDRPKCEARKVMTDMKGFDIQVSLQVNPMKDLLLYQKVFVIHVSTKHSVCHENFQRMNYCHTIT